MSPASRRIYLYWLLLLIPTLVVGAGAIQLLRREQARVSRQTEAVVAAREAAVAARARLVVENVELFVGDVRTGLLDILAAEPAGALDEFLGRWERSNPLVRVAFRSTADGQLLRPVADGLDEEARAFTRRFARGLGSRRPWDPSAVPPAEPAAFRFEERESKDEAIARQEISSNVAQVQSARRDVQELVKARDYAAGAAAERSAAASQYGGARRGRETEADAAAPAPALADTAAASSRPPADQDAGSIASAADARPEARRVATLKAQAAAAPPAAKAGPVDRRGWYPWIDDGRLHLIGWVQPGAAGEVRGVEVELAALVSRLAAALPAEPGADEGYVLRDHRGAVMHQAGWVPDGGASVATVPLAGDLLPGWSVSGYLRAGEASSAASSGFFWLGTLLVGIFVVAIMAGGSLLLWQARRSEAEAAQKTSFVANVSHEFKTPLTTIRLYAELLEQGRVRDAAQGGDYLRTIGRETQRLARLVNNALDFSRLEQGRKKFAPEPLELTAELTRLLDTQAPRLAEAGMAVKRIFPADTVVVQADRDAFEQIVLNLLDNACKYAASGGEIAVAVAPGKDGRGAEVRIGDRGPGVPPAHRERIFEKFHRVDDALTAEKAGAGLGLSIARRLARGLGGDLRYAARPGGGAEFILEFETANRP